MKPSPTHLSSVRGEAALVAALKGSRLFGGVDPAQLARLAAVAHRKSFHRGANLWLVGQPATHFTIIVSGLVKIVWRSPDGSEYMLGLFGPRESIGDAAVVGKAPYPGTAIAVSPRVEAVRVEAASILHAMATEAWAAQTTSRALLDHTKLLTSKIEVMSAGAVPQRLALLFLSLADRFGDEDEDGNLHVPVKVSRAELACLVGARSETVIRQLARWQKDGLVDTTVDGFTLPDPARLDAIAKGTGGSADVAEAG